MDGMHDKRLRNRVSDLQPGYEREKATHYASVRIKCGSAFRFSGTFVRGVESTKGAKVDNSAIMPTQQNQGTGGRPLSFLSWGVRLWRQLTHWIHFFRDQHR